MKFIEHSNSVYKSNRKYVSPKSKKIRKIIIESIIFIFVLTILAGVLSEAAQNNNSIMALRSSHRLGSYGEHKIAYGVSGSGSTIVLFESDIGETLLQWNPIILNSISGTRMIYYDRLGYGGSDFFKKETTVELQSEILNNLATNTGYSGRYMLVSEGYGSLIHLEYLKKYTDKVRGMILINPFIFQENGDNKSYFENLYENLNISVMKLLSSLSIPRILEKFSILNNSYINLYKEKASSRNKDNYLSRMMSKDYYSTILKEKSSMKKYLENLDLNNFGTYDIPIIIIESEKNRSDEYENMLKKHFKNLEIIYFEDTSEFTYTNSEYLINLISNMNSRIE